MNFQWLDETQGRRLVHIRHAATGLFQPPGTNESDHRAEHCSAMENAMHYLLPEGTSGKLTDDERLLLLASSWVLNLTWNWPAKWEGYKRECAGLPPTRLNDQQRHDRAERYLRQDSSLRELQINRQEADALQHLVMYHSLTRRLEDCRWDMPVGRNAVRIRLLAAYLRLAEAIHVDNACGPTTLFYFLQDPDTAERFHWLKNRIKPIIMPRPGNKLIEISINTRIIDRDDPLCQMVTTELTAQLQDVVPVLFAGEITSYLTTNVLPYEGPSISDEERLEWEKLAHEYAMTFPPNAGRQQSLYVGAVRAIVARANGNKKDVLEQLAQLQDVARAAWKFKPCHLGFYRRIIDVEEVLKVHREDGEKIRRMKDWLVNYETEMPQKLSALARNAVPDLRRSRRFFLFGYSSSVVAALEELFRDQLPTDSEIYVCEAHNKSHVDNSGRLTYIDGLNYAQAIQRAVPGVTVYLVPDITVSDVISLKGPAGAAVIFGANGVNFDGTFGHSAGHLSIAITAKHFGVPVFVLADTTKIGDLVPEKKLERREQWLKALTTMPPKVKTMNLRESIIEPDLVTKIITEDGSYTVQEFLIKYRPTR